MTEQPRKYTPRQLERRKRMLDAAAEVFFEFGFERTNLDQIIARVGCSKQTLYSYFGNKEQLFTALVRHVAGQTVASLPLELDGGRLEDYRQTLLHYAQSYLTAVCSPTVLALMRVAIDQAPRQPAVAEIFLEQGPGQANQSLADFLDRLVAAGHLTLQDSYQTAEMFLGMLRGELHMRALLLPGQPIERKQLAERAEKAVALLLDGCQT